MESLINSQLDAERILRTLKNVQVPNIGLELFTCGDLFRQQLHKVKKGLLNLANEQDYKEYLVVGGFGTGKSHFLNYLSWHLQKDAPVDTLICRVDLSNFDNIDNFQFNLIENIRTKNGDNIAKVLSESFLRVRNNIMSKEKGVTDESIKKAYSTLIYSVLGSAISSAVKVNINEFLKSINPLEKIVNFLANKAIIKTFDSALNNVPKSHKDFVQSFFHMIDNPNSPYSSFESPAKELSRNNQLFDVLFRIFKLAGFKMIVFLIDELESLNRNDNLLKPTLEKIRDFRDSFANATDRIGSYISTGLVLASTTNFYEAVIQEKSPALFDRFEVAKSKLLLRPLSDSDIDNLIYKLRELYHLAGIELKPIDYPNGDSDHSVIWLRKKVLNEFDQNVTRGLTTRRLVGKLLDEIETNWRN